MSSPALPFYPTQETTSLHLRLGYVIGCTIAAGTPNLIAASAFFQASDVGQPVTIIGAGALVGNRGALLVANVLTFVDSTHVTIDTNAITAVTDNSANNCTMYRERGTLEGSIQWTDSLTVNNTMTFTIADQLAFPLRGQPVLLSIDTVGHVFGGWITKIKRYNIPKHPGGDTGWKMADCTAVSWDKLVYRRVTGQPTAPATGSPAVSNPFAGVFTGMTLQAIAQYLVINALGADGISLSCPTGPTIPSFTVDYADCGSAFDQLIQAANGILNTWFWYMDPFKVLTIAENSTASAPWNISDQDGSDGYIQVQVAVTEDDSSYANICFVRSTSLTSDPVTTDFHGNGTTRTFNLDNPTQTAPTITLNGSAQTVGVLNVDTGKNWYYQIGSTTITQDNTGTILTASDTLEVVGPQIISGIVRYDNATAIAAESAIEGGTGFWEAVMQVDNPGTAVDATTLAAAYAQQYGVVPKLLEIFTYRPGLRAGQLISVVLGDIKVNGNYLIDSIQLTTAGNRMLFDVTAVGSPLTNWDWRATLATLKPGGGGSQQGTQLVPYEVVYVIPAAVARVQANDVTENHRRVTVNEAGSAFYLEAAYLTPKTPAGTSPAISLIVDLLVSQDQGVTWQSLFPTGSNNKLVLPPGSRGIAYTPTALVGSPAIATPSWVINPLLDGWLLRCDILQTSGAQSGFEVSLYGSIK